MNNPHTDADMPALTKLAPAAVDAAKAHMATIRDSRSAALAERISAYERRLLRWQGATEQLTLAIDNPGIRNRRHKDIVAVTSDTEALIASLGTAGAPMIRLVAVLIPRP
jgi:hypothetical protein